MVTLTWILGLIALLVFAVTAGKWIKGGRGK
jgi:hypothetical protein